MPRQKKVTPQSETTTVTNRVVKKPLSKEELLNNIKLSIKCKNETQKVLINGIKENHVTICTGPAGCGKTYLACYQSLVELKSESPINKIIIVKSVTTLKNEEIGFLKGSLSEKMEPFIYSFIKNFEKIVGVELIKSLMEDNTIETLPIAYMRGINIDNAIVIIDETQNISIENIRTILTRLGENSKMIFLGDIKQIDIKNKKDSALSFLVKNFNNIEGINIVEFNNDDIIRHPLIKKIEHIFTELENKDEINQKKLPTNKLKQRQKNIWLRKLKIFFKKNFFN
jgi:phosphate starvation-inducible PhoH-like protein